MKLLLDEMYPPVLAEQLRARGHDVASVHDPEYRRLEGAPDAEIFAAALAEKRVLVTENIPDFRRLEADAIARGLASPPLVFTTNRQFPRGEPGTTGRLVEALAVLMTERSTLRGSLFLKRRAESPACFARFSFPSKGPPWATGHTGCNAAPMAPVM